MIAARSGVAWYAIANCKLVTQERLLLMRLVKGTINDLQASLNNLEVHICCQTAPLRNSCSQYPCKRSVWAVL